MCDCNTLSRIVTHCNTPPTTKCQKKPVIHKHKRKGFNAICCSEVQGIRARGHRRAWTPLPLREWNRLFRTFNIQIASCKMSASGAPTNVAFPPSPTHLFRSLQQRLLKQAATLPITAIISAFVIVCGGVFILNLVVYPVDHCLCLHGNALQHTVTHCNTLQHTAKKKCQKKTDVHESKEKYSSA